MWISLACFGIGFMSWSAAEYVMHRFVGHGKRSKALFATEHIQHHAKPGYFTPNKTKIWAASRVILPMAIVTFIVLGELGLLYTLGFTVSYMSYEWVHYSFHTYPPKTGLGRVLRKHHFAHHFHNPSKNHGVTSRLWDRIFGTFQPIERVFVPERAAAQSMPWLLVPDTLDIRPEFQNDYAIQPLRSRA